MSILRKLIKENRRGRNKELALAIVLSTTAGVLTGIAINSKSDKISKTIKKIKKKSTECIEDGKNQMENLVEDSKRQMEDLVNQVEDLVKEQK